MIDAHQHFWQLANGYYRWLVPSMVPIYRDFMPDDLVPFLRRHGIGGTVLVQAADCFEETEFMQRTAAAADFVCGIVGWIDFDAKDAPRRVSDLAQAQTITGLRPMIQDIEDPDWMLRPGLAAVFGALAESGLVFEALVKPPHLDNLQRLLERHPRLKVVINHGGKPCIRAGVDGRGGLREWAPKMFRLADHPQVFCKFSGLLTEAGDNADIGDLQPYAEVLLEAFGAERLIWGSDWPVVCLAGGYDRWITMAHQLLGTLSASAQRQVWGGNARRCYRIAPNRNHPHVISA